MPPKKSNTLDNTAKSNKKANQRQERLRQGIKRHEYSNESKDYCILHIYVEVVILYSAH